MYTTTLEGEREKGECTTMEIKVTQLTKERIRQEQAKNSIIKEVMIWISNLGEKPCNLQAIGAPKELETLWKQFKTLVMEDGLLKKKWFEVGIKKSKTLVIVPEMIREEVMEKTHNSILTGHPGVEISYLTCRKDFYWPRMRDDFELYVAACMVGSSVKQPQAYSRVKHILYMIYHQFNDCVLIDCAYQDGTNSEG